MSDNAELWAKKGQELQKLENYCRVHNIDISDDLDVEDLRKIYIDRECGRLPDERSWRE